MLQETLVALAVRVSEATQITRAPLPISQLSADRRLVAVALVRFVAEQMTKAVAVACSPSARSRAHASAFQMRVRRPMQARPK